MSFHSINVPSEWELNWALQCPNGKWQVVSIQLTSPASGNSPYSASFGQIDCLQRFHSINVPSEWELDPDYVAAALEQYVSIQLTSPASGNAVEKEIVRISCYVSIQLTSPASGNNPMTAAERALKEVSIQLTSPASGNVATYSNLFRVN